MFLSVPVFYYLYLQRHSVVVDNVKGISTEIPTKVGATFRVSSRGGTWDLHQYLCDDRDACLKSLNVGKQWGIVSGGLTTNYAFTAVPSQNWGSNFKYLKVFVRSSWGSISHDFMPTLVNDKDGLEVTTVVSEGTPYTLVLIPLEKITANSHILVDFRDF